MNLKEKFDIFKSSLESENRDLTDQLNKLSADYISRIEKLKSDHMIENKQLQDHLSKQNEVSQFICSI